MSLSRRTFLLGVVAAGAVACGNRVDGAPSNASQGTAPSAGTATSATGASSTSSSVIAPGSVPGSSVTATAGPTTPTTASATTTTTAAPPAPTTRVSTTTPSTSPPAAAAFVDRGSSTSDKVALTFHTNGDLGLAQKVLDIAAAHHAVFTSFIVGNWLEANPSWAQKLLDGGHELANHTYSHPNFGSLGSNAMAEEIVKCRDVLVRLTGNGGRYFRPSGTDVGTARPSNAILTAASQAGYATVLGWDDEPFDYKDPGADAVRTRTLDQLKAGSIVSLHFGHVGTVEALPAILDGIEARGWKTATVSDLLA